MSYCLNPGCPRPQNPQETSFCRACGAKLLLKQRYRTLKPIGQGGFGRTFLACDEDKPSKPACVIKQFYPQALGTSNVQKAAELFGAEAMRLDELGKHPQIPDLLAHFDQDGWQYLVQEFVDGLTLDQELDRQGAFKETQIRQLLNDLLPVLQFVHDHQVIHRDIKPANIIRRAANNQLVLVDFGASKVATKAALMQTGTTIGSPEYVAPEQARGWAIFASDIYSLGVTCVRLLTARSPFDLYDIREDVWLWRKYLKHPVSNDLSQILEKMLQTATNRRYQSASEVLKALNSTTGVRPIVQPKPVASPTPTPANKSIIDRELAEISTQFTKVPPKNQNQPKTLPSSPDGNKFNSQIDQELEELKSQFLE